MATLSQMKHEILIKNKYLQSTQRMPLSLTIAENFRKLLGFPSCVRNGAKQRFIMYAVVKTGGKQYRVIGGQKLKVEQLLAEVGAEITLDQVLAVGEGESVKLGAPLVAGATVTAKVVAHGRGDKVHIFKMRRRKHYRKQQGHRQNYTELEIVGINS